MSWEKELEQLAVKRELGRRMGGADGIARQRAQSRLTVRERVDLLVDPGSFQEQYTSLGDVSVTVNKTTVFNKDPTREMVNDKLKEKAAELGADAVILVRYGEGGVSLLSWGSLEGKGRAIKYQP